ncbi:MAG: GlcNAc-PI de-N-acetylase [Armatimonadota bacterium]|nr:GlcNAc-PI de-N-acetylase [Armatimonadota bacterium]MDR7437978.1 GlcNAc-PI de-N-acetylase [Armatimonadota bacterium]MDR7473060.1 GlcNAc-PI de-N-acetylase [Armatimonadota bacterium]MDR7509397.1 GlcNAc-PI de-N-acetylase [Armatimonadota bacterium]MDR7516310.1 GlcNAc-PI de-N-acetylase [Armatimonadota bacterium]
MTEGAGTTVLLLATFGLEVVEAGGALALNALRGGRSEAAVLLARPSARAQIERAAAVLATRVRFLDGRYGEIEPSVDLKRRIVAVVREVRPQVVITQDPEHAFADLDPDRRPAMILYLEALALAGREWMIADCGGHPPHAVHTLYYLRPRRPNCVVDVTPVWDRLRQALAELQDQMAFSGQALRQLLGPRIETLVPGAGGMDDRAVGLASHLELERALLLSHGVGHHGRVVLAEPYRREGVFQLDALVP